MNPLLLILLAVIPFGGGELSVDFLTPRAARVRYGVPAPADTLPEWVYVDTPGVDVTVTGIPGGVRYSTGAMTVDVDTVAATVSMPGLFTTTSMRHEAPSAAMTWKNPADDHLYGLGQFQDGYLDVNGLSRRLTQVNTQISIPMVISPRGYGVLWNNYGMTEFNPGDMCVELKRTDTEGEVSEVEVTTTAGGARERRVSNRFEGEVTIPEKGRYGLLLDVGQRMARRHNLVIDGETVVNMANVWLPPTTSAIVELTPGTHRITAELEKDDRPTVWLRRLDGTTTFRSPEAQGVDFTLFTGTPDEIVSAYRTATGGTAPMPDWALRYIHCRERFHSQDELLENATEFHRRGLPVGTIVQDWQYWGPHGWNAMRFDEQAYPDPKAMTDSLHAMDMRLMLSVWSKLDPKSEVGAEALKRGYIIPGSEWVDFFNPEAAQYYWTNFSKRLLKPYGIDAWWQDATEPENDDLQGRRVGAGRWRGETMRNVYPLLVNRTVYEGLRRDDPDREPMILTRCGFPGIQRYGVAMWSGDVGHDWQTLRYQIAAGLGMAAAGMPWWTYDAGGFFRPAGQYTDPEYQEVMTRWIQAAVYLPLMRVHGYMSQTEPWRYGEETKARFEAAITEREALQPYLREVARMVSEEGYTPMRPLVFDYPDDAEALAVGERQWMLGPELMVCPVLEPGVTEMTVYLPEGEWTEVHTAVRYDGGKHVSVPVSMDYIPVFKK